MAKLMTDLDQLYKYFLGNWVDLLITFSIFFIFFLLRIRISKLIIKSISKIKIFTSKSSLEELEKSLLTPFRRLIVFLGIYLASGYLPLGKTADIFMVKLFKSALVITIASSLYNLDAFYERLFDKFDDSLNLGTSEMIKQVAVKMIRFGIVVLAIAIAVSEFFDVSGFVTGLGIVGVAFAMAAKDTLSGLFAGLFIIIDKPFDVGDWISCDGIEGTVEGITFRSTRIKTFSKELVSVPNQILASNSILNYSRRKTRRVNFNLGLTYSTTREQMVEVASKIEKVLLDDNTIDDENIIVRFGDFNDSSLDILINYYIKTIVYKEYLEIKEKINLQIMGILEECRVSAAFPSTSVYFENDIKTISDKKTI